MYNSLEKNLLDLEEISHKISDLINENQFHEILDLDIKRNEIIKKIYNNHNNNFSDKIYSLIKKNNKNVRKTEAKIIELQKNRNKFFKRLNAYKN